MCVHLHLCKYPLLSSSPDNRNIVSFLLSILSLLFLFPCTTVSLMCSFNIQQVSKEYAQISLIRSSVFILSLALNLSLTFCSCKTFLFSLPLQLSTIFVWMIMMISSILVYLWQYPGKGIISNKQAKLLLVSSFLFFHWMKCVAHTKLSAKTIFCLQMAFKEREKSLSFTLAVFFYAIVYTLKRKKESIYYSGKVYMK